MYVGELVNAFPDAIVICTTRDQERWWNSFSQMMKQVSPWWVPVVFWSLPTLRWFGKWYEGMDKRFVSFLQSPKPNGSNGACAVGDMSFIPASQSTAQVSVPFLSEEDC
jgi:hypothetical protein